MFTAGLAAGAASALAVLAEGDGFVVLAEAACDFALVAAGVVGVTGVAGVAGGDTVAPTAGEGSPWAAPAAESRALTSSGTLSGAVRSGVAADTPLEVFESVGAFGLDTVVASVAGAGAADAMCSLLGRCSLLG